MKKIVFYISSLEDGGAQRVISIISNYFVSSGFDVTILKHFKGENVFKLNEKIKVDSIEELCGSTNPIKTLPNIKKYFKENADLVISFLAPFNIIALLAKGDVPIIVADRNDPSKVPSNYFIRKLRDCLYTKADGIVLQTKDNQRYFNKMVQDKSVVIYNPIDIKDDLGLALKTDKEDLIVSVGRLERQKNHKLLIDSFKKIYENHKSYKLIIYGEGSYRKELQDYINLNNLNEVVSLPGSTHKVFKNISRAKCFVLSSDFEGMPNVLIEAMCLGLPCVSTDVSGVSELIEDGKNGFIVNKGDVESMTKRIETIISFDELAKSMGKEAIRLADRLKPENISNEWLTEINKILSNK